MKYLLIEDDPNKAKQMLSFFEEDFSYDNIILKKSYQSGLKELINNSFDLIFLDMQLPTFDIKSGEDGYKFRKLAGMDILNEMKRKNIQYKVIVITQFETFGEGEIYVDLTGLKRLLQENFPHIYLDAVFYNASQSKWKQDLRILINKFKSDDKNSNS